MSAFLARSRERRTRLAARRRRRVRDLFLALALMPAAIALGSDPIRLDLAEPAIDHVYSLTVAPDSRTVVLASGGPWHLRLWRADVAGTPPVEIGPGREIPWLWGEKFTPDSKRFIYQEQIPPPPDWGHSEAWCASLDEPGELARQVSPASPEGIGVRWSELTPDGSRLVYTSPITDASTIELWSAPPCGQPSDSVLLDPERPEGGHVGWYRIAPDSASIAYESQNVEPPYLRSTRTDGPEVRTLVDERADLQHSYFLDGGRDLVFLGRRDSKNALLFESFPGGAGATGCLTCAAGLDVEDLPAASGDAVVVAAYTPASSGIDLYAGDFSTDTPTLVKIGGKWSGLAPGVRVSADGEQVLYAGEKAGGGVEMRLVPIDGPAGAAQVFDVGSGTGIGWFEFVDGRSDVALVTTIYEGESDELGRCWRWEPSLGASAGRRSLFGPMRRIGEGPSACRQVPGRNGVLGMIAPSASAGEGYVYLTHLSGPPDAMPFPLFGGDGSRVPNHAWASLQLTADGEWIVFKAPDPEGDPARMHAWALQLPFFWDGFESGSLGHWNLGEEP